MNKCPVCSGSNLSRYRYDSHLGYVSRRAYIKQSLTCAFFPILRPFHHRYCDRLRTKLLFSPVFYLVRCNGCGYGMYDRSIDPRLLEEYYKTTYWQADGLPSGEWHDKHLYMEDSRAVGQYRCVQDWVERFAELNALEIGAGKAFFSRLLKENHKGKVQLNVVEPGNGWRPYYAGVGISLIASYFPFESSRKFHYIHTSHWLEHVSDVSDSLRAIKSLLVAGGLLFVEVPNCNDEYYSVDRGDSPHIHFFTKESLCTLLEENGFKTLTVGEYGLTWREELTRRADPANFDRDLLQVGDTSIRENIPREGGDSLRALFLLSGPGGSPRAERKWAKHGGGRMEGGC